MTREKYIISHSEAELHSRCEWAHRYGYGYTLTPKTTNDFLQTGSLGHELLQGYYEGLRDGMNFDDAYARGFDVWKNAIAEKKYDLKICNRVLKYYNLYTDFFHPDEWEIFWVEEYMEYSVTDEFILNGQIDLVVRAKSGPLFGRMGVVDHKWVYNFTNDNALGTHSQLPKYVYALNKLDIFPQKLDFAIINQIRWRDIENIKSPADHFSRLVLQNERLSEFKQASFMNEYLKQAKRIAEKRNLEPKYWEDHSARTTIKDICKYCDFADLCIQELEGGDIRTSMKVHFAQRDLSYRDERKRINGVTRRSSEES